MKKVSIAITMFLVIVSSSIFAQSGTINLGIEGGAGINSTRGVFDPGLGYTGQVFCEYNLSKIFSTRIGLGFDQKGAYEETKMSDHTGAELYDYNLKQEFDFLSLPVLVRANFGSK